MIFIRLSTMNTFGAEKGKKAIPPKKMREWIEEMNAGKLQFLSFK